MMLEETELCLIVVTISRFNQEGLHLGLAAEAFLINALVDSLDNKINSLVTDPSKGIFSGLRIAWCTSTNLQSSRSASFSWKRWFANQAFTFAGNFGMGMVEALISANFCERLLC